MPEGAGAGTSIPVSVSTARATAIPQNTFAPTYFVFQSPDTSFGGNSQEANPVLPTTAESSAALGGNAATGAGSGTGTANVGASSNNVLLYIALGVSAIGAIIGAIALFRRP